VLRVVHAVARVGLEICEELMDVLLRCRVSLDLALPPARDGVVDELLLDAEPGTQPRCVVAGGEEKRIP
jgi:hypothetical protein